MLFVTEATSCGRSGSYGCNDASSTSCPRRISSRLWSGSPLSRTCSSSSARTSESNPWFSGVATGHVALWCAAEDLIPIQIAAINATTHARVAGSIIALPAHWPPDGRKPSTLYPTERA